MRSNNLADILEGLHNILLIILYFHRALIKVTQSANQNIFVPNSLIICIQNSNITIDFEKKNNMNLAR